MSWDDGGVDGIARDIPERANKYDKITRLILAIVKEAFDVEGDEAECEFDLPTGEHVKVTIVMDYRKDRGEAQ